MRLAPRIPTTLHSELDLSASHSAKKSDHIILKLHELANSKSVHETLLVQLHGIAIGPGMS